MIPSVIRIEPASQCNLACSHCPTGTIDMERGLMTENTFSIVVSELKKYVQHLSAVVFYHGGEPLLNKDVYSMIKEVRSLSPTLKLKIVTNGMVLNKKNSVKLIESGLDEIEVSLDGESAEESEAIRINSDSAKIIRNLKSLIRARKSLGSKAIINLVTTQFLRSEDELNHLGSHVAAIPKWLEVIFGDDVHYKPFIAMKWPHMKVSTDYRLMVGEGEDKNRCEHTYEALTIRANGEVVPCCYDLTSQLVMGNIFDQSLESIFNGEKYDKLRKSIDRQAYPELCSNCNKVRKPIYLIRNKIETCQLA